MPLGGDMPWYQVEIAENSSATALMNAFELAYRDELSSSPAPPTDVSVYHRETATGGHVYCFSPGASSLAPELLRQWNASACAEDPDLSHFEEIRI